MAGPASSAMLRPRELGFYLTFRHGTRSLWLVFGVWMAIADTWLFASVVPQVQRDMVVQVPTLSRIAANVRSALLHEIEYRLIALTAIAWLIARSSGRRDGRAVWPAILLVALAVYPLGLWDYFSMLHWSWLTVARELLLHGGAGVLGGWLYWRHGWLACLAGQAAAQIALQPLLTVLS